MGALTEPICAVITGVAPADLYAVSGSSRLTDSPGHPRTIARRLQGLCSLEVARLSVRAVVGWLCVEDTMDVPDQHDQVRYEYVHDWAAAGLGEGGWLFAGAGFTLTETLAAKRAGTLDPDQARLMAVLRGVNLPVG